jgi:hypothetical protein
MGKTKLRSKREIAVRYNTKEIIKKLSPIQIQILVIRYNPRGKKLEKSRGLTTPKLFIPRLSPMSPKTCVVIKRASRRKFFTI